MKHILPLYMVECINVLYISDTGTQSAPANWIFGRGAGLQFTPDGSTLQFGSIVFSREGASAASDETTGELLFYTDGSVIWDRSHAVMANGSGLSGDYSSSQSGAIVPKPGDPSRYYVFTADYWGAARGTHNPSSTLRLT